MSWPGKPHPSSSPANSPIFGDYETLYVLGQGGAAIVYKARHRATGQVVALKVLRAKASQNEQFDRRFVREISIFQKITHHGVLKYLDCAVDESGIFFVMEYAPGGTLADALEDHGVLAPNQILGYLSQILSALQYLHEHEIIHRDLKPANLFLFDSQTLKIGDLGLALDQSAVGLTLAGMTVGSVLYMSPEQIMGQKTGVQSDLYSLGCVLYEMLTGTPPFKSKDAYTVMESHLHRPLTFPELITTSLQPKTAFLRTLIQKLMSKEQADRPMTALSVLSLMRPHLDPPQIGV